MVEVDASLPVLYKESSLLALRQASESERSEYQVLAVQGDATVRQELIAPYLAMEDLIEAMPVSAVAVTPANYKFRYVGEIGAGAASTYIFRITPRKKRDGLIEGELWIDSLTGVGVLQKGSFVKTPATPGARIQVVRDTRLLNGLPCVRITHVAIETRAGHGELTITEYPLTAGEENPASFGPALEPTGRVMRGFQIQ
jgi:hypothetical protein